MQKREWAEEAVAKLQNGQAAQVKPTGHSMQGKVSDGDLVTLEPCQPQDLVAGDIVLARIKGRRYFHLVLHLIIKCEANKFLIGNNHGRLDGWITAESVFGKVTKVQAPTHSATETA
jgi:SOS-response transcriptional repressor LexA